MGGWVRDWARVFWLLAGPGALALLVNSLSASPVPLLSPNGPGAWPDRAERITAAELGVRLRLGKAVLLVDVRSRAEFDQAHPAGAVHVPADEVAEAYAGAGLSSMMKAAAEVVVLCGDGECPLADRAARTLRDLGRIPVRVLDGGWESYRRSGLPLRVP